jgi:hypothetical protein
MNSKTRDNNMHPRVFFALLVAVSLICPARSFAHGFLMFRNGNQIDGMTENVPVIENRLFSSTTFATMNGFAAEHGAIQADSGSGFNIAADTFRMDLAGVLWYSSGGPPIKAPANVKLTGLNQYTAQKIEISRDGVSPQFPGFPITGTDNHEVFWTLTGPIQAGVYGVSYHASGLAGGSPATPYETSELFVVALSTVGFNNVNAVKMVYAAATAIPGDFDLDGDVDGADFVVWQTHFPSTSGAELITGDADLDGDVDGADFVAWQTHFPTAPSPATVPEPSGIWLIAAGFALTAALLKQRCVRCNSARL